MGRAAERDRHRPRGPGAPCRRERALLPEGHVRGGHRPAPLPPGAFMAAATAGARVVPLALRGTRRVMRGDWGLPRPGPVSLWVGEPIAPEGTDMAALVRLRSRVADAIAARCGEPRLDLVAAGPSARHELRRLGLADVERARAVLAPYLTPDAAAAELGRAGERPPDQARVLAAHGFLQGARRPALLSTLRDEERRRGVVAASAGNHALGVAFAASRLGGALPATLFVPRTAPRSKVEKLRRFPVEVRETGETYDDAVLAARAFERETGAVFVPAFEDPRTAAGQGTVGLEVLDELPRGGDGARAGGRRRPDRRPGHRRQGEGARRPRGRRPAGRFAGSPRVAAPRPAPAHVPRRPHPRRRARGRHRRDRLPAP